jgi:hypothetical protein
MKRIVLLLLSVLFVCSLCSCDPGTYSVDEESLSDVVSIELIKYENPEQEHFSSWVPDHSDDLLSFDSSRATVLETLPDEKISDFLDSFSKSDILHEYYAYNSPKDICIRLNYEDGSFLIIWANYEQNSYAGYIGEYESDGGVSTFWGSFSALIYYEDLVEQYFTTELE